MAGNELCQVQSGVNMLMVVYLLR